MTDVIEQSSASETRPSAAALRPHRLGVDSLASTVSIVVLLIAGPILVATRLPRWISEGIPEGLILSDATVIPAGVLFFYLVRSLISSYQTRAIDLRPSDAYLGKAFAKMVERSHFGVGRAREWTTHNPNTSLHSVDYNVVFDRHIVRTPDQLPEFVVPVVEPELPPEPVVPEVMFAETEDYEVERGDSWWTLAVDRLDDGRRWSEIRDLNMNRVMPDGTVLTAEAHLLKGFVIVLPVKVANEDA